MIKALINGKETELESEITVSKLLETYKLPAEGVAVAINSDIVSRPTFGSTCIQEGDKVELIRAIGGG